MILVVDNYDSFVFNLARYFERLGHETQVTRNDAVDVAAIRRLRPDAIVLSPGPCAPDQAGCSLAVIRELYREIPILGVCLGHQAIGQAFGGQVVRAPRPVHGSASAIHHAGAGIFAGLPSPLAAARYHSLVVEADTLPACLEPTAWSDDGCLMACEHREYPVVGVQFHPESILTEHGYELLCAFLHRAGLQAANLPTFDTELIAPPERPLPVGPVTF
jgi:anthranilate synthase/aminodeoxychorismate synthase-like glutamine amidotransferase